MARRDANTRLTALLRQVGWSGQKLANAVNTAGRENRWVLRYDRTSVAHWLAGSRPSPAVAALVAEVLSRRLGHVVDPDETGLTTAGTPATKEATADVVAPLVRLGGTQHQLIYTIAQLRLPDMTELAAMSPPAAAHNRERVGTAQVRAAALMLSMFSHSDFAFGGGHALPALSAYLATDVASWLRASATPSARARLYSAAAGLAYLAGWMCFDDNRHGTAQRYYHTAAQFAAIGGNTSCYAAAMRGLSVQAHYLGHRDTALSLAEAAMCQARHVSPLEAASLTGQLAVAEAARGRHDIARTHLTRAEHLLDRAPADSAAVAAYHVAALLHQHAETFAASGDTKAAIKVLTASLRHRPPTERRARAITTARLAELHLDAGHIDRACTAWNALLDDRPQLSSGRIEEAVRSMRARLRPHSRHPGALALITRATTQSKP
jgi:tetratricopeptide (TPR) repeat protein